MGDALLDKLRRDSFMAKDYDNPEVVAFQLRAGIKALDYLDLEGKLTHLEKGALCVIRDLEAEVRIKGMDGRNGASS